MSKGVCSEQSRGVPATDSTQYFHASFQCGHIILRNASSERGVFFTAAFALEYCTKKEEKGLGSK
jgi:hypothetical protein